METIARPFTTQNQQTFFDTYLEELKGQMTKDPAAFRYPIEHAPVVARNMVHALSVKSGSKESVAIKRTCKTLSIPYTYEGISLFLSQKGD